MKKRKLMTKIERKKRIKMILPYLKKHWKILDCACGDGWLTNYLNENGYDCVGIDKELYTPPPNKSVGSKSKAKGTSKNKDRFFQFNALNMPFKDNTFDCVVSIQTLEHVICEKEFSRVLKPDGLLLAEVPRWDFPFKVLDMFGLIQAGIKQHIRDVDFYNFPPFTKNGVFITGFGLCKFGVFRNAK